MSLQASCETNKGWISAQFKLPSCFVSTFLIKAHYLVQNWAWGGRSWTELGSVNWPELSWITHNFKPILSVYLMIRATVLRYVDRSRTPGISKANYKCEPWIMGARVCQTLWYVWVGWCEATPTSCTFSTIVNDRVESWRRSDKNPVSGSRPRVPLAYQWWLGWQQLRPEPHSIVKERSQLFTETIFTQTATIVLVSEEVFIPSSIVLL